MTEVSVVRFVDAIKTSPTTRLDLTVEPWRVLKDGTSCPDPQVRYQTSASGLTDGALVTDSLYDNRELTLSLMLNAPNPATAATEMQKLRRELGRRSPVSGQPDNIISWQPNDGSPVVYFRCYRTANVLPDVDHGVGVYKFVIRIVAEPFAIGAMVDLGNFTVNQDPAAGSNPCYFEVSGISGDVDTPLVLTVDDSDFRATGLAIGTRRRGTPSMGGTGAARWVWQGESSSFFADTSSGSGDATCSNGGYARVTFATDATMAYRAAVFWPNPTFVGSTDYSGTYRAFARLRKSSAAAVMRVRIDQINLSGVEVPVDTSSTGLHTYDLGLISIPAGSLGFADGYGAEIPAVPQQLTFLAQRVSGTGTLDLDYVFMVPADAELAIATTNNMAYATVFDGVNRCEYVVDASTGGRVSINADTPIRRDGSLPMLSVGSQTTRVFILNDLAVSKAVAVGSSASWNARYWPRYLYIRPAGS